MASTQLGFDAAPLSLTKREVVSTSSTLQAIRFHDRRITSSKTSNPKTHDLPTSAFYQCARRYTL